MYGYISIFRRYLSPCNTCMLAIKLLERILDMLVIPGSPRFYVQEKWNWANEDNEFVLENKFVVLSITDSFLCYLFL